jgi:hypothetical protein
MPRPVPPETRQSLFELAKGGYSTNELAARLRLAPRTVRNLLAQLRRCPEAPPFAA